jgi:hypothetical protein
MRGNNHLTVQDKLVLAAYHLEREGRSPFTAEDLVVAAWRDYPDTFGLAGYKTAEGTLMYPDSNRVFAEIMGSKPVRKRGLLTKVGEKMYRLTEAGTHHATLLIQRAGDDTSQKSGLGRDVRHYVERLLESRAMRKYREARSEEITFFDACAFYGISPRSSAIELQGQIANFLGVLEAAKNAAGRDAVTLQHDGKRYDAEDINNLFAVHELVQRKFKKELDIIRMRIDERRQA